MRIRESAPRTRGGRNKIVDSDKIIQELNQRFAAPLPEFYKRRIIFWYDEDEEFRERLD